MKRIACILLALLLLGALALPCFAADDDFWYDAEFDTSDYEEDDALSFYDGNSYVYAYNADDVPDIPSAISATRGARLYDGAELLTSGEESALLAQLDTISEALQFDVVIVTAKSIGERTPMAFADDYFDYNGFGYGDTRDGCLLLISMAYRDWWVSTCGSGITALDSDYFIDFLEDDSFLDLLSNGEYYDSFTRFAGLVETFVTEAQNGSPYSASHRYRTAGQTLFGIAISVVIGVVIAAIITFAISRGYTHAVHKNVGADNYLVQNSMRLTVQEDRFLYTNVDRTERASESSGGGGGSHTSSSGSSHGGGGGKF